MRTGVTETRPTLIPAAQYVRMSDEGQQFSIENQKAAIHEYATRHGFEVVRTYADAGKSGVVLKNRAALSGLLKDVLGGTTEYKVILVYDVSRWGRFPNSDEAAHYEFLCTDSGIPLHYCAESFSNDESPSSSILKSMKRSMAAEFSRELGDKVTRGKTRLVQMGFWVGGPAGYGYRRMMVSADGKRKRKLKDGEHKSLTTDRIILVPGPRKEIECVRQMFSTAVEGRHGASAIATDLNKRGIACYGKQWTDVTVRAVLTNPKYKGWNVWHRKTLRLGSKRRPVASEQWITKPGAFTPLVDEQTFDRVQAILPTKADRSWTDDEILKKVKRVLKAKGRLSESLLRKARGMPAITTLHAHFGSFRHMYRMAGYHLPVVDVFRGCERMERALRLRREVVRQIVEMFPHALTVTHLPHRNRSILRLKDGTMISVLLCPVLRPLQRKLRWLVQPIPAECEFVTLICRMKPEYDGIDGYHVFPGIKIISRRSRKDDPWLTGGVRLKNLSELLIVVKACRKRNLQSKIDPGRPGPIPRFRSGSTKKSSTQRR